MRRLAVLLVSLLCFSMCYAQSQPVWIVAKNNRNDCGDYSLTSMLLKLDSATGGIVDTIVLGDGYVYSMDVDKTSGDVWVLTLNGNIRRYSASGELELDIANPGDYRFIITADFRTGGAWIGGYDGMVQINALGVVSAVVDGAHVPEFDGWINPTNGIFSFIDLPRYTYGGTQDIRHVDEFGNTISVSMTGGSGVTAYNPFATGVDGDPVTGYIYACSPFQGGLAWKFDPQTGQELIKIASPTAGTVAVRPDGKIWISSRWNGSGLRLYDQNLALLGQATGMGNVNTRDLDVEDNNVTWALDESIPNKIFRLDVDGNVTMTLSVADLIHQPSSEAYAQFLRVGPPEDLSLPAGDLCEATVDPPGIGIGNKGQGEAIGKGVEGRHLGLIKNGSIGTCQQDIALSKCGAAYRYIKGGIVPFEIRVSNDGTAASSEFRLVDSLPAAWVAVSATPAFDSAVGSEVTWTVPEVAPGGSMKFVINARIEGECDFTTVNTAEAVDLEGDAVRSNNSAESEPLLVECGVGPGGL